MSSTALPHGRDYSVKEIEKIIEESNEDKAQFGADTFFEHYLWKSKMDDRLHQKRKALTGAKALNANLDSVSGILPQRH